jgi:A118 family predicted phage portal protein
MFQKILTWISEVIKRMIGQSTVKQALNVNVAISTEMASALQLWTQMYENKAYWLNDTVKSLNLPAAIAGELSRSATLEMVVEFTEGARAKYLETQFKRVLAKIDMVTEYGSAKGGVVLKPYVKGSEIYVDLVHADQFYPVAFDEDGDFTAAVFVDQRQAGDKFYTRLEYHSMTAAGCQIVNMAYQSDARDTLGRQVSLGTIAEWADILPEATITGIDRPLFAYFKFPLANNIDATSALGVSCYSRATELIHDADVQWSNLLWEFESGQRALYVDVLAFGKDSSGKPMLPNKRLYKTIDTGGTADAMFEDWSPTFREESILKGLDAILKRIEYTTGLAYGTLSDPATIDKTATEIKTSKQRTYATITAVQKALQKALDDLIWAMDVWTTLANLAPAGPYAVTYQFDDSVLVDTDLQFQQDLRLVTQGLMSKVEFRMRNFREKEEVARAKIAEVLAEQPQQVDPFAGA